jgi:GNAT superfamily N-acetyltransferase
MQSDRIKMPSHPDALSLVPVDSRALQKQFIQLPKRLYANDPNWIAPLDLEQRDRLFGNNPFFEHADFQAWLAFRDGQVVGRITAQVDHLHAQHQNEEVGYFGMLEAEDNIDIFDALLSEAAAWLRERNCAVIRGPFNLSINEEIGVAVNGFDRPPFIMMGHSHPYIAATLEKLGFERAKQMYTYTIHPQFETPKVMAKLVANVSSRVKVRCLDRKRAKDEFETLRDIFNDAWSENWGFVPFTQNEFNELAKALSFLLDDDWVQIAEVDGTPAAFIVVLPNVNEAIKDLNGRMLPFGWAKLIWRMKVRHPRSARVPLMGVRKKFQHSMLGPALAFMVIDQVRKPVLAKGVNKVEMGWILENNAGMRNIIETIGGEIYKTYRMYQKAL